MIPRRWTKPWNGTRTKAGTKSGARCSLGRDDQRRLWIRDALGNRLVDLHQERNAALELLVPGPADQPLYVLERAEGTDGRRTIRQATIPVQARAEPVWLAALEQAPASAAARGQDELFETLFEEPFGPEAYARCQRQLSATPAPVFGISLEDEARMRHYLSALARADRQDRLTLGTIISGAGAVMAVGGAAAALEADSSEGRTGGYVLLGSGVAALSVGLWRFFDRSHGERAFASFEAELRRPDANAELVIARSEAHLYNLAARERKGRRAAEIVAYVAGGLYLASAGALAAMKLQGTTQEIPSWMPITVGGMGAC